MTFEHRGELRADPGSAPGERNVEAPVRRNSVWPSIAVVAAAAAFGGVIWFAYKNGREASSNGQPPLVKAETGPVKVKPELPAGQDQQFRESPVYNRLEGDGKPQGAEKILPPPEAPASRAPLPPPIETGPAPAGQAAAIPDALPPASDSSPTALAPPPGAMIVPPSKLSPPPKAAPAVRPAPVAPPVLAKSKPAEKPVDRKSEQPTTIAALESRSLATTPSPKTDTARKPVATTITQAHQSGAYRIQLSAVRSQDAATAEWTRLRHRYPELAGLSLKAGRADIPGKGVYYRIQAGPLDETSAKSTCDHLRAQGTGCIVVKP